ncbi:MAG: HAD family hydrolase [Boseongicola sp. SB0673_bin_14]|nr:HAD family hydrolase [Boseongicola sp. SB0673_bin_14]
MTLATRKADVESESTFHVGDSPEEPEASRAAGVTALGAGWGLGDRRLLDAWEPDKLFTSVEELQRFFLEFFPLPRMFRRSGG